MVTSYFPTRFKFINHRILWFGVVMEIVLNCVILIVMVIHIGTDNAFADSDSRLLTEYLIRYAYVGVSFVGLLVSVSLFGGFYRNWCLGVDRSALLLVAIAMSMYGIVTIAYLIVVAFHGMFVARFDDGVWFWELVLFGGFVGVWRVAVVMMSCCCCVGWRRTEKTGGYLEEKLGYEMIGGRSLSADVEDHDGIEFGVDELLSLQHLEIDYASLVEHSQMWSLLRGKLLMGERRGVEESENERKPVSVRVLKSSWRSKRDGFVGNLREARLLLDLNNFDLVIDCFGVAFIGDDHSNNVIVLQDFGGFVRFDEFLETSSGRLGNDRDCRNRWVSQVASVVEELHRRSIIIGNLQSKSFIVNTTDYNLKLTDLQFASELKFNNNSNNPHSNEVSCDILHTRVSWNYTAPEILDAVFGNKAQEQSHVTFTPSCDVFSFGCVVFEIFSGGGVPPRRGDDINSRSGSIKNSNWKSRLKGLCEDDEMVALIEGVWGVDPVLRELCFNHYLMKVE